MLKRMFSRRFADAPEVPMDVWHRDQIKQWLKSLQLAKYAAAKLSLGTLTGEQILQLQRADVYQLVKNPDDACVIWNSLANHKLQALKRATPSTPSRPPATPLSIEDVHIGVEEERPEVEDVYTHNPLADEAYETGELNASLTVYEEEEEDVPPATPTASDEEEVAQAGVVVQAPQTGDTENLKDDDALDSDDNVVLDETVVNEEQARLVFDAVYRLTNLVRSVQVNKENCMKMANLGRDALGILEAASKRSIAVEDVVVQSLVASLDDAYALVEAYKHAGWFLRVVCNEHMKEDFDTLHNGIVEVMKSGRLSTLPCGKELPRADYRDIVKPARRVLKQLGSGSLKGGVAALRCSHEALVELAAQLAVRPEALAEELSKLPMSDLELDALYAGLTDSPQVATEQPALYRDLFQHYDKDNSDGIEAVELALVLADLGMLEGKRGSDVEALVTSSFKAADSDGSGALDFDEFCKFYDALAVHRGRQMLRFRLGLQAEENLKAIFYSFCSFGNRQALSDMDGARFMKLCRDCKLVDRKFSNTDADIVFAGVKVKGQRKVTFDQFLEAMIHVAEKRGSEFEAVVRQVLKVGGPIIHATRAEAVRLHDDKSTYTGVYAKGGPNVLEAAPQNLQNLLDRSAADVRGVKKATQARTSKYTEYSSLAVSMEVPPKRLGRGDTAKAALRTSAMGPLALRRSMMADRRENGLHGVFCQFAHFGGPNTPPKVVEMDGTRFVKLCRDCQLLDAKFTRTSADLIFTKCKPRGTHRISYKDFQRALELVAEEKSMDVQELHRLLMGSKGPTVNAVQPDDVRFYDTRV